MKIEQIYIASSWKNRHAVEMLTDHLRAMGITVVSFIDEAARAEGNEIKNFSIDEWIDSEDGFAKFVYDTDGATKSDLVIYIGPSGPDAWAECGAAWASGVPVVGLFAKGEQIGLMRRMLAHWYYDYKSLLSMISDERNAI
jgi:hypothetical protein